MTMLYHAKHGKMRYQQNRYAHSAELAESVQETKKITYCHSIMLTLTCAADSADRALCHVSYL